MSFTHLFVSTSLLVGVTFALPATTYALQDTYDYTNWLSKFSVQNVCTLVYISSKKILSLEQIADPTRWLLPSPLLEIILIYA